MLKTHEHLNSAIVETLGHIGDEKAIAPLLHLLENTDDINN